MKLLLEQNDESVLVEQKESEDGSGKHWYLEGVFLQANEKNRNGRVYPMEIMEPEVERYKKEYVDKHRALGELGHPTSNMTTINFDNVTHIIEKIWRDGNYFKARARLLDTPKGKIAQELARNGVQLGVSSRALGSVIRKEGVDYVGKDFRLITASDLVFDPSAQTAYPTAICEDTEYELDPKTGEYVAVNSKALTESQKSAESAKKTQRQISELKNLINEAKTISVLKRVEPSEMSAEELYQFWPATRSMKVYDWYKKFFPKDSWAIKEMNKEITFNTLYKALKVGGFDIYELIGVGDSIVRERIFCGLSSAFNTDYDKIYDMWLK